MRTASTGLNFRLPPSALPGISPSKGEIGHTPASRFRSPPNTAGLALSAFIPLQQVSHIAAEHPAPSTHGKVRKRAAI
ncbi:hypothetical protein C0075_10715 [Rhizobium sp. KAs_5_22]|nr:hypothetical protein C0075_10715 [Rhizobium sp. KAs_5_22]